MAHRLPEAPPSWVPQAAPGWRTSVPPKVAGSVAQLHCRRLSCSVAPLGRPYIWPRIPGSRRTHVPRNAQVVQH
eukprot:11281163-Alexandrium_andersonii.AAC.1